MILAISFKNKLYFVCYPKLKLGLLKSEIKIDNSRLKEIWQLLLILDFNKYSICQTLKQIGINVKMT